MSDHKYTASEPCPVCGGCGQLTSEYLGLDQAVYNIPEVAKALDFERRTVARLIASGKFPTPDLQVGHMPYWTRASLVSWMRGGASEPCAVCGGWGPLTSSYLDLDQAVYNIPEVSKALEWERRLVERLIVMGRFPTPDIQIGRMPHWTRETLVSWLNGSAA